MNPCLRSLLLLTIVFVGCVPAQERVQVLPEEPELDAESHLHSQIEEDLDRLRSLNLFEIDGLVGIHGDIDEQAGRLSQLVDRALFPGDDYVCYTTALSVLDESLETLRSRGIIQVGEMFMDLPEGNPACDGEPCAEDIHEAERSNEHRANRIWGLATSSYDL